MVLVQVVTAQIFFLSAAIKVEALYQSLMVEMSQIILPILVAIIVLVVQ